MRMSKAELQDLATKQHSAVSHFLNRASIKGQLTEPLVDSKERVLLIHLLRAHHPVKYEHDKYLLEEFNTSTTLSTVVKRLNKFLEKYSDQVDVLKKNSIRITIPTKLGGLQLGKYLTCQNMATLEYLDDVSTKEILLQAWIEFKKKQKRETVAKKRTTLLSVENRQLRYLQHIEQVLRIGHSEKPRWFRKTGPIAADFDDGRVYRREERLKDLREIVFSNVVSMLEGFGATGKTVLTLSLAYDFHNEGRTHLYYFDCDRNRDFDQSQLIRDIRSVKGIFILENIHLAPDKFQAVYSDFKYDQDRNILFTTRSSFRDFQSSRIENLVEIKTVELEPFEPANALIAKYCSHQDTVEMSEDIKQEIKDICEGSLWLLSYALQGYTEANGQGDARSWLERGVREDLNDLKNINSDYPEVLVAISPLYRSEVLTAESYLTGKLGFDYDVLGQLVRRGEITYQETDDGLVFYGLPHSSLAAVYWEHGKEYRRRRNIPEFDDFICDYAASASPNGLEAAINAGDNLLKQVTDYLVANDKLVSAIANARHTWLVISWLQKTDVKIIANKSVIAALVSKMEEHDCAVHIGDFFLEFYFRGKQYWQDFCSLLNPKKLVDRMCVTGGAMSVALSIYPMLRYDKITMRKIYDIMGTRKLIAELNQAEVLMDIGRCISVIYQLDLGANKKLTQFFKWRNFATTLSREEDMWVVEQNIREILYADRDRAYDLCNILPLKTLAKSVIEATYIDIWQSVGTCISTICRANQEAAQKLWRLLDKEELAAKLTSAESMYYAMGIYQCIDAVYAICNDMAYDFCELLSVKDIVAKLDQEDNVPDTVHVITSVLRANQQVGRQLWQFLDRKGLIDKLSSPEYSYEIGSCVYCLYSADASVAKDFCAEFNMEKLASILKLKDAIERESCLRHIGNANKKVHQRVLDLLHE